MVTKSKSLLVSFVATILICILIFLKTNSIETIPQEDKAALQRLSELITLSKIHPEIAIEKLKNLTDLPDYTNYKKNYILARLYEKKNDLTEAIAIYKTIQNKNYPLKERIIFHLAHLNTQTGNDIEALELFNKLLKDFPNSKTVPQAKYYLAQTLLRLRYTNEAIDTLRSLKKHYPETQFGIASNYYLGENAFNKKDYKEAIKFWREYLKQSPDGRFANEIAEFINQISNYIPLELSDYSLLGDVFYYKKDYFNAARYYKSGKNISRYYQLAYSLYRTNNKQEAINYFKSYAKNFPKSKNARLALYYGGLCMPSFLQKDFYAKAEKEIPELAYYAIYKQALLESNITKKKNKIKTILEQYPENDFTLESVWEIMWLTIKEKNYLVAEAIGEKYFKNANLLNQKSETMAKIGYWLGKIAELTNKRDKAIEYYKKTQNILFDSYYALRARYKLSNNNNSVQWEQPFNPIIDNSFSWTIPSLVEEDVIKKHFGIPVLELINLQQYDEAIELIGKSKFPTKQVTAWLKALNSEYETSINIAGSIINQYDLDTKNPIWELAYPTYFGEYILNSCKNYSNIDPFLILALIRQESRFETQAISTSNAYGLMQLILPTAKETARQLNTKLNSPKELYDPKINIALGTKYFSALVNSFNNPLFAVASYNAGPHVVNNWIRKFNTYDLDFFIEEIPYDQTRNYVKKVFASYWTYLELYTSG